MDDATDCIIAQIDISTAAGHNLRALLLRLADRDDVLDGNVFSACIDAADDLGVALGCVDQYGLTPLGREVAERLRPVPWRVVAETRRGLFGFRVEISIDEGAMYRTNDPTAAERIAALLTAEDIDKAKRYL